MSSSSCIPGRYFNCLLGAYYTKIVANDHWNVVAAFVRGLDVDHRAQMAHASFARPPLASWKFLFLSSSEMPAT